MFRYDVENKKMWFWCLSFSHRERRSRMWHHRERGGAMWANEDEGAFGLWTLNWIYLFVCFSFLPCLQLKMKKYDAVWPMKWLFLFVVERNVKISPLNDLIQRAGTCTRMSARWFSYEHNDSSSATWQRCVWSFNERLRVVKLYRHSRLLQVEI